MADERVVAFNDGVEFRGVHLYAREDGTMAVTTEAVVTRADLLNRLSEELRKAEEGAVLAHEAAAHYLQVLTEVREALPTRFVSLRERIDAVLGVGDVA